MVFQISQNRDLTQEANPSITLYLRKNKNGSVYLMGDVFVIGTFMDGCFTLVDSGFEYSGIKLGQPISI